MLCFDHEVCLKSGSKKLRNRNQMKAYDEGDLVVWPIIPQ